MDLESKHTGDKTADAADAQDVRSFGYQPELRRTITARALFAIAFSTASVTVAVVTVYGVVLGEGYVSMFAWIPVAIGFFLIATVYGYMTRKIPLSGLSYQWIARLSNPVLAFIVGWLSVTSFVLGVVSINYACAQVVLPSLFNYVPTETTIALVTGLLILGEGAVIAVSTAWTTKINNVAVVIEIIVTIGLTLSLIIVGAARGLLHTSNIGNRSPFEHMATGSYFSLGGLAHVSPFAVVIIIAVTALAGWENAANVVEEAHSPRLNAPRAMQIATALCGVLSIIFFLGLNLTASPAAAASSSPVPAVIKSVLGNVIGNIFVVIVLFAYLCVGLMLSLYVVRYIWAMARDERFPAAKTLAKIHPRYNTPFASTVAVVVLSEIILFAFSHSTSALFNLVTATGLLLVIVYLVTVVLFLVKSRELVSEDPRKARTQRIVAGVAAAFLIFALAICRDAQFKVPWLYALAVFVVGIIGLAIVLARYPGSMRKEAEALREVQDHSVA